MKLFFAALYRYACSYTYIDVAISKKIGSLLKKTKIIFPKQQKTTNSAYSGACES